MATQGMELDPSSLQERTDDADAPPKRRFISIRLIVTAASAALISAAVLGVGAVAERHARKTLTHEIETRLLMMARNLASLSSSALLSEFPELTLHPLVKEVQAEHPELEFVVVLDHEGKVQGHIDVRTLGSLFKMPEDLEQVEPSTEARIWTSRDILVASAPAESRSGMQIGKALVGLQRGYVDAAVKESRKQQGAVTLVLLALGIVSALVLMSVLLRPVGALRAGLARIGRGDLDTPLRLPGRTELGLLAEAVNDMASQLKTAQLEMVEKERLAHEMDLARDIQVSLLPSSKTVAGEFVIEGAHQAAAEVGGDYFDVLELPDGKYGVAIADVAGKGLAGCLVMSMLAALLRSFRTSFTSPSSLLIALEEHLSVNLRPGSFVTMFYAVLDPERGRITYASAGHSPLLVYRASTGTCEWIKTDGIPIGAIRGGALATTLADKVVELGPGDEIVQFTDGVNESWCVERQEQFGFERVERLVTENAPRGCQAVLEVVRKELADWTGDVPRIDDETILVVHRELPKAGGPVEDTTTPGEHVQETKEGMGVPNSLIRTLWDRRETGSFLTIQADVSELWRIREWMRHRTPLEFPSETDLMLLENGLYEVCANIVEHGYDSDPERVVDVWWIPDSTERHASCDPSTEDASEDPQAEESNACEGYFLIRDHGVAFSPAGRPQVDLNDPTVRTRGRGLGLKIVQEVMSQVIFEPSTPSGNITVLRFDPAKHRTSKEVSHVATTG